MRVVWRRRKAYDVIEEFRLIPRFLAQLFERKMAPFLDMGNRRRTVLAVGGDKFSVIEFEKSLSHASGDLQQVVAVHVCGALWKGLS